MVGPKYEVENGKGTQFHAKGKMTTDGTILWQFEELATPVQSANMLLIRVLVAKVAKTGRLITVLRNVPVRQGEPEWNCVAWVKEALQMLKADGKALGTAVIAWDAVRDAAMSYCKRKKDQHRFDGKAEFVTTRIATFDLLGGRETIP